MRGRGGSRSRPGRIGGGVDVALWVGQARDMSTKPRSEVLEESKKKGVVAGAAAAATVVAGVAVSLPAAAVLAVPTAVLGWRWWKHRAENGIRF